MPSVRPPQDVSSSAAPPDISLLPVRSPGSAPRWSGSADPANAADPPVVGWPRELSETTPVVPARAPAITSSCNAALRSELPLATGSSTGCAPAPSAAGATAGAADRDSPSSLPRSAECDLPASSPAAAGHPLDPSSACAPVSCESPPRRRSTTQSLARLVVVQTRVRVHWLPSPPAPTFPGLRDRDRTSPLPPGVAIVALHNLPFRYPQTQSVGSPGDNRIL